MSPLLLPAIAQPARPPRAWRAIGVGFGHDAGDGGRRRFRERGALDRHRRATLGDEFAALSVDAARHRSLDELLREADILMCRERRDRGAPCS